MGATIRKEFGFGQSGVSNFDPESVNLKGILKSIVDDLNALKVAQDAIIDATSFVVLNAVTKVSIGTVKE